MALIKVGIHEDLILSDKTKINDKGTLELAIKAIQSPDALLNAFEGNDTFTSMESSFRFYPPNMKDFDGAVKTSADIAAEVLKIRHQLIQYAMLYGTKEEVTQAIGGLAMFNGLGITQDQIKGALNQFNQEAFTQKVVTNLCTLFLNFLKEKNAFNGQVRFRHKFLRQSKDKNFATIPTSDFDVWVESMDVPKSASKIAFSEYEIANGKHNGDPVSSSGSEASAEDANKAADLFAPQAAPIEPVADQPDLLTATE